MFGQPLCTDRHLHNTGIVIMDHVVEGCKFLPSYGLSSIHGNMILVIYFPYQKKIFLSATLNIIYCSS